MLPTSMKIFLLSVFTLFFVPLFSFAQQCTGSLGDPTVSIDFGTAATPLSIGYGNISYKAATQGCPEPGEYGLRGLLFGCDNNTWQTTSADHTLHDHDGNYLLVNATSNPGIFYSQRVDELCPNTTYEMSVWIANLLKKTGCNGRGIKPNITLQVETISGTVLSSSNTGDILETDQLEWKQYATSFRTSPTITSVVL